MRVSSDTLTGSPTFAVKTARTDTGGWTAYVPAVPQIGIVESADEISAIRDATMRLTQWTMTGCPQTLPGVTRRRDGGT